MFSWEHRLDIPRENSRILVKHAPVIAFPNSTEKPQAGLFGAQARSCHPFKVKALFLHTSGSIQQGARGYQG